MTLQDRSGLLSLSCELNGVCHIHLYISYWGTKMLLDSLLIYFSWYPLGPLCITQTMCACFAFVSLLECENLVLPMYYKSKFICKNFVCPDVSLIWSTRRDQGSKDLRLPPTIVNWLILKVCSFMVKLFQSHSLILCAWLTQSQCMLSLTKVTKLKNILNAINFSDHPAI